MINYDNIIKNSGFREINIASTHTFCTVKSRIHQNCDRIFPYFCPNVYAFAFLRMCSYAPDLISLARLSSGNEDLNFDMVLLYVSEQQFKQTHSLKITSYRRQCV